MVSRCDECRLLFRHPEDYEETVVNEKMTVFSSLDNDVQKQIRQKVSLLLCPTCLKKLDGLGVSHL